MLLHEITLDTTVLRHQKSDKVLGQPGVQGIALRTNKPGVVRKVYGLDDFNDPYYRFITVIQQHQDNPFFPRIYKHKVYKDKPLKHDRGSYFMTGVVMMEKLVPLNNRKLDERTFGMLFGNLGFEEVWDSVDLYGLFNNRSKMQEAIKKTTNEHFAAALQVLVDMGRNAFDLHAGNWMVRLTSTGPQLVILDPMFGEDVTFF